MVIEIVFCINSINLLSLLSLIQRLDEHPLKSAKDLFAAPVAEGEEMRRMIKHDKYFTGEPLIRYGHLSNMDTSNTDTFLCPNKILTYFL